MTSRRLLRVSALLVLLAWAGFACSEDEKTYDGGLPRISGVKALAELMPRARAAGFDVVVVTIDTLRADHVGCYGAGREATPVIDALARKALRFEQALASAPITLPSHCTLFTGRLPPGHGVRNNGTFQLAKEQKTLAEILSENGYATGAAVGAFVLDSRFGLDQGFDRYDDTIGARKDGSSAHYNERPASEVIDASLNWLGRQLDAHPEQPFFLWSHLFDPHFPYRPPVTWRPKGADPKELYRAEIRYTDHELGRLVEFLRERERLDRTLFVVTADHGESLGEHEEDFHGFFAYEATTRVPLIIACPALLEEGRVIEKPLAGLVDLVPSLLHLLGIESAAPVDGRNLFDARREENRPVYAEAMLPLLNHGWASLHALRDLDRKYIRAPEPEFYDLRSDPTETKNLIGEIDEAGRKLRTRLDEMMSAWGDVEAVAEAEAELDPELASRLAALGYGRVVRGGGAKGRQDPKRMVRLYRKTKVAMTLTDRGRHEDAIEAAKLVLRGAPENRDAWVVAALANLRLKRWDECEQCLRQAAALGSDARVHFQLGQVLVQKQKHQEGRAEIAKALELDPRYGEAWILRGQSYAMESNWAEARRCFEKAKAVDASGSGERADQMLEKLRRQPR